MFQALLAHLQEALYIQLVYCVGWLITATQHNTHKIYQLLYIQYLLMMSKWMLETYRCY
jgi:hypothetical protein